MRLLILLAFLFSSIIVFAQSPCNCCSDQFRQFDFWIGEWNVYDSTEALLGTNIIDVIQDSCVLRENWNSARSAYTGTSYNFYDPVMGQWTQTWVDNQGGSLFLKGQLNDGSMQLMSDPIRDKQGRQVVNRITWTPQTNGSVRQHWEAMIDGAPWTTVFDGEYRRK